MIAMETGHIAKNAMKQEDKTAKHYGRRKSMITKLGVETINCTLDLNTQIHPTLLDRFVAWLVRKIA